MKHTEKGFSLIELVLVMIVLAILVAVAWPMFENFTAASAKTVMASTTQSLQDGINTANGKLTSEALSTRKVVVDGKTLYFYWNSNAYGSHLTASGTPTSDSEGPAATDTYPPKPYSGAAGPVGWGPTCADLWNALVQGPRASTDTSATFQASGVDNSPVCNYLYLNDSAGRSITYNFKTGTVTSVNP